MTDKQYRMRQKLFPQGWTAWQPHTLGSNFNVDLDRYDSIEWRDTPKKCTAVAPVEIEEVGRPTCERWDSTVCTETGSHLYTLEVEVDDYYDQCSHERQITWSALGG